MLVYAPRYSHSASTMRSLVGCHLFVVRMAIVWVACKARVSRLLIGGRMVELRSMGQYRIGAGGVNGRVQQGQFSRLSGSGNTSNIRLRCSYICRSRISAVIVWYWSGSCVTLTSVILPPIKLGQHGWSSKGLSIAVNPAPQLRLSFPFPSTTLTSRTLLDISNFFFRP